jgi:hypothetical protein
MSLALAPAATAATQVLNPLDVILTGFNTNPYFIGLMMLLLNLGGRFLAMEVTKQQERFFQNTWVRGGLIFVVVFVATRNVLVAFWLSLLILILVRLLFNENSAFYLLQREGFQDTTAPSGEVSPLTPEEADIYRKLTDKLAKAAPPAAAKKEDDQPALSTEQVYLLNMSRLQI